MCLGRSLLFQVEAEKHLGRKNNCRPEDFHVLLDIHSPNSFGCWIESILTSTDFSFESRTTGQSSSRILTKVPFSMSLVHSLEILLSFVYPSVNTDDKCHVLCCSTITWLFDTNFLVLKTRLYAALMVQGVNFLWCVEMVLGSLEFGYLLQ